MYCRVVNGFLLKLLLCLLDIKTVCTHKQSRTNSNGNNVLQFQNQFSETIFYISVFKDFEYSVSLFYRQMIVNTNAGLSSVLLVFT